MSLITEKERKALEVGAMGSLALDHLGPILRKRRETLISELCVSYKSKALDFPTLCGKIGELTLIEDTLKAMTREVTQGRLAEAKIFPGE